MELELLQGPPINKIIFYGVIIAYFTVVLGLGALFSTQTRTTKDFFFSGQRFSAWLIAFSCVATVIGSYSFVKYSAVGFRYGLSSTTTYLNDWFLAPLFLLGWMPIIYYSRVTSIPEYFKKRFDERTRSMAILFIMLYMIGYIGINLYTMGVAADAIAPMEKLVLKYFPGSSSMDADGVMMATKISRFTWATLVAIVGAIYVTAGGQSAVIISDLIQALFMLLAGIAIFFLGIHLLGANNPEHLGGFSAFWHGLPQSHRLPFSGFAQPEKFPMVGIFWQDFFGASMFLYFGNQGLIMRFLAGKSVNEGRRATYAVILLLMPLSALAVSAVGWIGRAMLTYNLIPKDFDPEDTFVLITARIVTNPVLFGFILAALTAALMSTIDTLLNASSAIAVNDVWKPFIRPGRPDKHYLNMARLFSSLFAFTGLLLVPLYMSFNSIYVAHATFTAAVSPPLIATVIFGILWKRFSARAAFLTLFLGGILMGLSIKWPILIKPLAALHGMEPGTGYNYMRALYGMLLCSTIAVTASLIWPNRDLAGIEGLWLGSLAAAKRRFKGSAPNDQESGRKIRLRLVPADQDIADTAEALEKIIVSVPPAAAEQMKARTGDLVYVCDKRWWLGGLRSLHATLAVDASQDGVARLAPTAIKYGALRKGEDVSIEKII